MTINEIQDQIIEEFSELDDWMDKYQLLIDLGSEQEPLAEEYKTDSNLIEGCQSRVWLQADEVDGRLVFQAESDALIVKGIVSLLVKVLSGHTAEEIADADLYFIEEIGLKEHLSPTRSNGLVAMVKQMRLYALAYKAKHNCENKKGVLSTPFLNYYLISKSQGTKYCASIIGFISSARAPYLGAIRAEIIEGSFQRVATRIIVA